MSSTENNYVNTDLGNVALNSCGEYNADSSYEYLDTVNYEGGSYFCKVEFPKKISGIAPKAGVSTEFWQLLTIPGDATSEYIKLHDEVVNKAKQVETSRVAVELSQTEVEAAQTDVRQMRQDTQEASQTAIASRDSAAGYAQSAEASRTAAKESEDNINAQVTRFDTHVAEKTSAAETAITEARRAAVSAVSTKQDNATQAVIDEGDKQIKNVEDAGAEQVGKAKSAGASAVSAAGAAGVSAVNAVKAQQTASIKAVADKGTQQVTAVNTAGSTQVSTIETKGADQVKAIKEAGENAFQNISNGVDKGLSEEGKAADAKATGEAISKLTEDTTALQKRQNVLVGSETGNPVSCDDAYSAPLCGLTVYGRSTQDGTPTPEAPVPIVSAGDDGSVAVNVTGANMLEGTKPGVKSTVGGITYTIYENGVLITGTAIKTFNISLHEDTNRRLTRGIYYLTTRGISPSATLNFYFIGKFSSDVQNRQVTLARDLEFSLTLQILKGATLNTTIQVSLTRNKMTTYSPYREQLLTLPTPNGLPGIPVTSGGNYTDENGQQWICDEVDLERGMKVLRIDKGAFDATKALAEQNVIRDTYIETPLTPAEIAAYKALTTYAPDTVVQASDGAGIKLDYQRDVNLVVKNLEDAIASMTTT